MSANYVHNYPTSLNGFKQAMKDIDINRLSDYVDELEREQQFDRLKIARGVLDYRLSAMVDRGNRSAAIKRFVDEVNKEWAPRYRATLAKDGMDVYYNGKKVASVSNRFAVTGEDGDAVEQLQYMVNR